MTPFDQGWRDYLRGYPPRTYYRSTLPSVRYERGRHLAALWKFYIRSCGSTIHSANGETSLAQFANAWTFEQAKSFMPPSLLDVIAAEEKFCTLNCETP